MKTEKQQGIYILTNRLNGKSYVGKDVNLGSRVKEHLRLKCPGCVMIHRAIKKYGAENFDVTLIPCPGVSLEELSAIEVRAISDYGSYENGYNLTKGGEGTLGYVPSDEWRAEKSESMSGEKNHFYGRTHSEETRHLLSKVHTGRRHTEETKAKWSDLQSGEGNGFYGKKHSEESKRDMSEKAKGRVPWNKGKKATEEARRNQSESHKGQVPWNKGKKTGRKAKKSAPSQLTLFES